MVSNTETEELLYVGQFTIDSLPNSYTDEDAVRNRLPRFGNPITAPFPRTFGFKINHVVHSTHAYEMESICQMKLGIPKACFIAKPKRKSKFCKQFRRLKYKDGQWIEEAPVVTNPLPGHYVWFSMKPTLPEDEQFNEAHYPVSYVDGTSFYGPWSFTFGYSELIEAYEKQIPAGAHVVLKNGGTLMYKREVCYVVIVTHSHDEIHDGKTFPTTTTDDVLELSDSYSCPPTFHPRCVPPPYPCDVRDPDQTRWKGYAWNKLGHYDQVAFAVHSDWEGNSFEIDLPDGQPKSFFDSNPEDVLTYSQFHPICHSKGNRQYVERHDSERYVSMTDIRKTIPCCYDTELQEWMKTSLRQKLVIKAPAVVQRSLVEKDLGHTQRMQRLLQRDPLQRKPLGNCCQSNFWTSARRKNILHLSRPRSSIGWKDVVVGVIAGCIGISFAYSACINLVR